MTPMKQLEQSLIRTIELCQVPEREWAYNNMLSVVRGLVKLEVQHINAAYEAGYNAAKADHHFDQQEAQP